MENLDETNVATQPIPDENVEELYNFNVFEYVQILVDKWKYYKAQYENACVKYPLYMPNGKRTPLHRSNCVPNPWDISAYYKCEHYTRDHDEYVYTTNYMMRRSINIDLRRITFWINQIMIIIQKYKDNDIDFLYSNQFELNNSNIFYILLDDIELEFPNCSIYGTDMNAISAFIKQIGEANINWTDYEFEIEPFTNEMRFLLRAI
jgi:hypothetical protein